MNRKKAGEWIKRLRLNRYRSLSPSLRLPVIAFAVFVLYVLINTAVKHYNPIETTPAAQVTVDDAITVSGCFIREEQVIDVEDVRTAEYNFNDGDKVGVGASLVTLYQDDKTLGQSQKLEETETRIAQLETLRSNSYVTNTSQIEQKIMTELNRTADLVDSASFGQIPESMGQLRAYALKSGTMDGEISNIDGKIKKLEKKAKKLKKSIQGKTSEITSEYSGYFCQTIDGYEDILTAADIDTLTPTEFAKRTAKNPSNVSPDACKIISSYNWYYGCLLTPEQAKKLHKGQSVTLRFSQPSDNVAANVYAIRTDEESEEVLVLFESDDMNEELVSMRKEVSDVALATYTGLRIPHDALRKPDAEGEDGVYILNDTVASFKKVQILFEGEDFYIVKQNVIGDDSLVVNDDVIVRAKDVDDKKVVK